MGDDSKSSKDMLQQTLASFMEATKFILSSWRKLKICDEPFCTLLNGISQITVSRGGQLLQADMAGSSPEALFEAVVKLSCEIIEFGWTKEDRALVDTFIMRLAASVRERNDYEDEVKETPEPRSRSANTTSRGARGGADRGGRNSSVDSSSTGNRMNT